MKVQLVERQLKPKGIPVPLNIKPRQFEGDTATSILEQIKEYVASDVIPRIPFLRLDEPYRKQVRAMGTVELSRMLVDYINDQLDTSFSSPESDEEALETLRDMGFLLVDG